MDKKFKVKVDEFPEYELNSSDLSKLDLLKLSSTKFHVLKNHKSFNISLIKSDFPNKSYIININSNNYTVKISNQLDILINDLGLSIGSTKRENTIKAPMPGLILNVNVKEGQEVKKGETLIILEAMKMENAIESPNNGVIKSIYVKNGKTVEKGELMIELK